MSNAIVTDYFPTLENAVGPADAYARTPAGRADLEDHLLGRVDTARREIIPWLDDLRGLDGANVLEVGCGTGTSTLCLAEQGAKVVAMDVSDGAIQVARVRCELAGVAESVSFFAGNGTSLSEVAGGADYEFVIFFACLEHMTTEERLVSLRAAWENLRPGGHLVVIETPNRLWWLDNHTSVTPFFHWLPDDLAIRYSTYTDREHFNRQFDRADPYDASVRLEFARWGRGASYHEFVLALDCPVAKLPIAGVLPDFVGRRYSFREQWRDKRYSELLSRLAPEIPDAFLSSYLNLALRRA